MDYITIILVSICMTVCLVGGSLLWAKRTDVPDRSRSYLSVFCLWVGVGCTLFLSYGYVKPHPGFSRTLLAPELVFGGLFATIMYLCYPIEVMRPRQFRGRWLLLFLPLLIVTMRSVLMLPGYSAAMSGCCTITSSTTPAPMLCTYA